MTHHTFASFSRILSAAVLMTVSIGTGAQPAAAQLKDVKGAKDNPIVKRYEGSVIIGYDFRKFNDYELLLGPVQAGETGPRNLLKPTKSEHVEGQTTRILYVAPEGRSPLEVVRNYEQELQKNGFEILFKCAREKCGSQDGWLAEYYLYGQKRKLLNHPPAGTGRPPGQVSEYAFSNTKDQQYLAAKRTSPEGDVYASVYVALGQFDMHKETFDHALVLLDVIETKPMETKMVTVDASTMAKGIAATGHVALYGIYFDTDKAEVKPESGATLKEIAALLKQDPKLALYVVGHTDNVGGEDYNMDLSRRRAAAVVAALTSQHGVDPKRLKPSGVGLLAPVGPNETEEGRAKNRRVELVKR
jgi:outer membrane protein OmpA-like peptidoglycan-associated protein